MAAGWNKFTSDETKQPTKNFGNGLPPRNYRLGWVKMLSIITYSKIITILYGKIFHSTLSRTYHIISYNFHIYCVTIHRPF